ncbi:MAG: hypothetical protein ACUVUP_06810 [Thermaceae bacterium]
MHLVGLLSLFFLLAWAAPSQVDLAREFMEKWLAGEASPSLEDLLKTSPEELPQTLERFFAYPPPPKELRVNLDAPRLEEGQVLFPATLGEKGMEVAVYLEEDRISRMVLVQERLPSWVKTPSFGLLVLLLGVYWASALWGRGLLSRLFREALALLKEERSLYIGLNLLLYGLFALGGVLASIEPRLAQAIQRGVGGVLEDLGLEEARSKGVLSLLGAIYYWNLTQGLVLTTLVPALLLGLPALLLNASRYLLFGLALSPALLPLPVYLLHLPTLVLELQAYILGTFGGGLLLLSLLRREGYRTGVKRLLLMGYLGAVVLLWAAVYEALELGVLLR